MSFDLHLQHFSAGDSAPIDPAPVAIVLASEGYTGPDQFGFYCVGFADGVNVEFNAGGLDGKKPFTGCAFHIRGIGPSLIQFVFDVARAGDFVIFNCQGEDSEASPVLILVNQSQAAQLPAELQYVNRPICTSAEILGTLLFPGYDRWEAYRDQVIKNG
jgi:hypothetical protein